MQFGNLPPKTRESLIGAVWAVLDEAGEFGIETEIEEEKGNAIEKLEGLDQEWCPNGIPEHLCRGLECGHEQIFTASTTITIRAVQECARCPFKAVLTRKGTDDIRPAMAVELENTGWGWIENDLCCPACLGTFWEGKEGHEEKGSELKGVYQVDSRLSSLAIGGWAEKGGPTISSYPEANPDPLYALAQKDREANGILDRLRAALKDAEETAELNRKQANDIAGLEKELELTRSMLQRQDDVTVSKFLAVDRSTNRDGVCALCGCPASRSLEYQIEGDGAPPGWVHLCPPCQPASNGPMRMSDVRAAECRTNDPCDPNCPTC